ncbi:DUF1622 domain-containing protein [Nocardioides aquaticus]|uniref:DUF1622 domain-containing protein n=1 Tax=Nocardioides aquaticus TaxID=160826 RepID=UPI001BD671E0|nr:DUF1622 domain-containing protein [Nocardioides aquaticus]
MTEGAALLITVAAVLLTVLIWLATRAWRPTVPVLLELLLAAGLLRLSVNDDWRAIAGAAAIVAIRTLVKYAGNSETGLASAAMLNRPAGRVARRQGHPVEGFH